MHICTYTLRRCVRCWSSSRIQSSCAIPSSGDIRMSSAYSLSPPTSYLPLPTSYLLFLSLPTYVGGIRMSSAYSLSSPLCGGTHTRATCGFAGPSSDRMPECSARLDTALAPSPPPPARDRQRLTHHMHMQPPMCICIHTICTCSLPCAYAFNALTGPCRPEAHTPYAYAPTHHMHMQPHHVHMHS